MVLGNQTPTYKRMKMNPFLTPYTKNNSNGIKDQNLRTKTLNLLEENKGEIFHNPGFGNDFLDITPKEQATNKTKKLIQYSSKLKHERTQSRQ